MILVWLLISFFAGLIMCLLGLVWLGGKMKNPHSKPKNSDGLNSIQEMGETIVTVLNSKKGDH